jgi:hypothetical protein
MIQAVAALLERNGDDLGAIQQYMKSLEKMNLTQIAMELLIIVQDSLPREIKRQKIYRDKDRPLSSEEIIHICGSHYEYEECYKNQRLSDIDDLIQKACDLAKRSFALRGEDVWFCILISLGDWIKTINSKLQHESKSKEFENLVVKANSLGIKLHDVVNLIEDFIIKRKNSITMKQVPFSIEPRVLMDKLDLDLRSIRKIFDFKVK